MKRFGTPRSLFVAGFALVVAVNAVVAARVIGNRTGTPSALVTLTERELRLPYWQRAENSGMSLPLTWRVLGDDPAGYSRSGPQWLTASKAKELGFATGNAQCEQTPIKQPLPREAYLVLEYEGPAYQEAIHRAEQAVAQKAAALNAHSGEKRAIDEHQQASEWLQREQMNASRLFAVDAGLDFGTLRQRYPDSSRYIVVHGIVRWHINCGQQQDQGSGFISALDIQNIHVPLHFRRILDELIDRDRTSGNRQKETPRYAVAVAYGSRLEPWITAVQPLQQATGGK